VRTRTQPRQRLDDQREAVREVVPWSAVEPHAHTLLAGDDAEAVVFDLVQPPSPSGRFCGWAWARRQPEKSGGPKWGISCYRFLLSAAGGSYL
jgi:hypothetical protein